MILIKKTFGFFFSIVSIILINFFILNEKRKNKDTKIIFFYFPVKIYQDNILELINILKEEKNFKIVLGYNIGTSNEIKKLNNSFFLNLGYLKYISNVDIFLSSYVVYNFPKTTNKVYINHDIYDTPMVNIEKEKELMRALNKCNYIFLSSDISIKNLQKKFNVHIENQNKINKTKFINTGYLKLDHVNQKITKNKLEENSILLAPTLSSMLPEYNLESIIETVIKNILKSEHLKLIYRPHPGDIKNKNQKRNIEKILDKFKKHNNFVFDHNISYIDSYKKSKFLITDFSGTAYTYAFSTLKPVIFISKNEKKLIESELNDLYYFRDRLDVGKINQDLEKISQDIKEITNLKEHFSEKIKSLRNKRIKYFNCAIEQNLYNIKNILN